MAERKVYRPEEKMKIVMDGLSGTISVSDLYRKYEIKPARFYYWKDQVMNSAQDIFQNRGRKIDEDRIRAEKDDEIVKSEEFRQWVLSLMPLDVRDKGIFKMALWKIKNKIKLGKGLNPKTKIVKILIKQYNEGKPSNEE